MKQSNEDDPGHTPDIDISEALSEKGIILINGPISSSHISVCMTLLEYHYDESFKGPVKMFINSEGGLTSIGWAIVDMMNAVRYPIETYALGEVGSAAVDIFFNGTKRYMAEHATLLIHSHTASRDGNYHELKAKEKFDDMEYQRLIKHLIAHSKYKTSEQIINNLLGPTDLWLNAEEALEHGLCDDIFKKFPAAKSSKPSRNNRSNRSNN
jgi:ATP-dependent Clp protease protease subunit